MRWVIARVLPVPAPASTHSGVPKLPATSRCSGSSAARSASASAGAEGAVASGAAVWSVIALHPARAVRRTTGCCGRRVPHTPTGGRRAGERRSGLGGAAVPVVDQGAAHRGGAGQLDLVGRERGGELLAAEPARLGDLLVLEGELAGLRRPGAVAEHERAREGPGLAAHVLDLGDGHAHLLGDLAGDGVLEALAGLDEAGEHRME